MKFPLQTAKLHRVTGSTVYILLFVACWFAAIGDKQINIILSYINLNVFFYTVSTYVVQLLGLYTIIIYS